MNYKNIKLDKKLSKILLAEKINLKKALRKHFCTQNNKSLICEGILKSQT